MKKKISLPHFTLVFEKKSEEPLQLKIIVTRKIGKAVQRNRIKRVLREFFRQKRELLPWGSVVCRVHSNTATVKNAELFQELSKIL